MARKVVLDTYYTFTPGASGAGSVVINKAIPRERLILITNVTTNQVIYNFSDPNLKASSYTVATDSSGNVTTTVVFNYDTTAMGSTNKLQIIVDEYEEKFVPAEVQTDSVNKFRVSTPQALIDTDFELSTQPSKWESIALVNQRPGAYFGSGSLAIPGIQYINFPTNSKTVTVGLIGSTATTPGLTTTAAPPVGTPINIQDTFLNYANGNFIVESVAGIGSTLFTYTAKGINTSTTLTNIYDSAKTGIFTGAYYTGAGIGTIAGIAYTTVNIAAGTAVTITTGIAHGLQIGNEIAVSGLTTSAGLAPNGNFFVSSVLGPTTFTYYTPNIPVGTVGVVGGSVFSRPQAQVLHRPADGGVIFSPETSSNNQAVVRQTRIYFRYQSGKGIQASSGTILRPSYSVDSLIGTTVGITTVNVITKETHNIQTIPVGTGFGTVIQISGASDPAYNGTFLVTAITGPNSFQYVTTSAVTTTNPSGDFSASVTSWYGATNRLGIFDQQNGIFFEYDGQTLYAVRRSSTFQIAGRVSVTNGSHALTRSDALFPTAFSRQLSPGDRIVIRGQSYKVLSVESDNLATITPAYRGPTTSLTICSKTVDIKIPQSSWNLDRCDGTGASGYTLNLTKMQMFYIDYSWYGAGFIRWGFRGPDGNVIYAHKLKNNNVNTEAYMRSGNLPARYEIMTDPPITTITGTVLSTDNYIGVASTAGFPPYGTLLIRNSDLSNYEYVNYSGIGTTAFTGVVRAKAGISSLSITGLTTSTNVGTANTANLQIGQRIIGANIPDNTQIGLIGIGTFTLTRAVTGIASTATVAPLAIATPQTFTYSATNPKSVELAFPAFSPTLSHWGTSIIMDGRFDDDKSLVFTYGQTKAITISQGSQALLLGIRVAPSVDSGVAGAFGTRELINRMQLVLRTLDITTSTANANLLVKGFLNASPGVGVTWTNAVSNAAYTPNSSFAQIADYATSGSIVSSFSGGETTAGFFVGSGANSIDLAQVRNLGNSIVGGGSSTLSNGGIYPDGPDTLTIVVSNLSTTSPATVYARISWTEAQA
jgi:hypothetical protein